jgi:hypothetical protein
MAWKKLDDELTDPTTQEPLSAFLVRGLTRNVNDYSTALTRGGAFAFDNQTMAMQWASYDQPTGFVFTVDVGIASTQVQFDIVGNTKTDTAGGTLVIRHLDSSTQRFTPIAADSNLQLRTVSFDFVSPMSGLQGFFIGWQSDVGPDLGFVWLRGGVENQIFVDEGTGGTHWPFPVGAGLGTETHLLLRIDQVTNSGNVQPSGDARRDYQICYFRHIDGSNPDGTFVIWPELDQTPAVLATRLVPAKDKIGGHVFELGCFQLWSVAATTTEVQVGGAGLPNAYDQTTALGSIAHAPSNFLTPVMPSLSNILTSPGRFGRVLLAGETLYFPFAVQNKAPFGVQVNFRAFSFNIAQPNFDTPTFYFDVLDSGGNPIGTQVLLEKQSVPRFVPQTAYGASGGSLVCANGVYGNADEWGMRDAMPVVEVMRPTPIAMRWASTTLEALTVGGAGTTYTGQITATSDLYIFAFSSRLF